MVFYDLVTKEMFNKIEGHEGPIVDMDLWLVFKVNLFHRSSGKDDNSQIMLTASLDKTVGVWTTDDDGD